MELIFMPECEIAIPIREVDALATSLFERVIDELHLHSLQKIVITGSETDAYNAALQQHGSKLDHHINITNTAGLQSAAVVIHCIRPEKGIEQIVFIKDFIYSTFVISLLSMDNSVTLNIGESQVNIGLSLVMHEFGHAIEYQTSYERYEYHSPDKVFNLQYEYEDFIHHEAMQLWSEYFAEIVALSIAPQLSADALDNIIEYIDNTEYPAQLNAQLNHSYRVAYNLVHYLAFLHCSQGALPDFESFEKYFPLSGYQESFQFISDTLTDLFSRNGYWDFEKDSRHLAEAYNALITYERRRYLPQ